MGKRGGRGPIDVDEQVRILRTLWEPHPGQRAVITYPARFRVVAAGRRWGKSSLGVHLALEYALEQNGATVWWVSPSYQQSNDFGFDPMVRQLSPDVLAGEPKRTKPRRIELTNGSTLDFRSAEREDSLRGGGIDFLVIDEAAAVPERAWTEELRPALSDTLGDMLAISTPKGRGWFWRMAKRGRSEDHPDVMSFQAPSKQNPHVPNSEIEAARDDMPGRAFKQEYLSEFLDDSGGVFEDVRSHVENYSLPVAVANTSSPYALGVDFGRLENYTVTTVLDADGRLVAFDRIRETTWYRIQQRVERLADRYSPCTVTVDGSRDNKIVADLEDAGLDVEPVKFSSSKKQTLIDNLATKLEAGEITLSSDAPQLINELEVYEFDMTETGRVRYSAPSGFKDDCVDALALSADSERQKRHRGPSGSGTW